MIRLPFFLRQAIVQDGANATTYVSEAFDTAGMTSVVIEARVSGMVGTTPELEVAVQVASVLNVTDNQWDEPLTVMTFTAPGGDTRVLAIGPTPPLGLVRIRATLTAAGSNAVVNMQVIGFGRTG